MAANPLILSADDLKRLPMPKIAIGAIPQAAPIIAPPDPNVPVLPSAQGPIVTKMPDAAIANTRADLLGHQGELARLNATGSGISQIKNPFLRTLAKIGDTAESIIAPRAAAFTPGTEMNHQRLLNQETGRIGNDLGQQYQQAQTEQEGALTDYTRQRPDIEQSKIDQRQTAIRDRVAQAAAARGQNVVWDNEGVPSFSDDHESEAFKEHQALESFHKSTAAKNDLLAELKKNSYIPGTNEYAQWKKKADQVDAAHAIALGALGIRAQGLELRKENQGLNEDKFYNPQPTATQRSKGDLAQSAVERIAEMRAVVKKHPDWFGPGGGRAQNVKTAIGNQDPDIQTYMSAAQYLADHSAGVFGGRGQYIMQQLHSLTDPHYNPAALNAALDEAERSSQGFISAGKTHGKGEKSGYGGEAPKATHRYNPATGKIEAIQ